jgi:predicted transcriptional regulator
VELTSVLLSIRPKYAKAIMNESKEYEFRKSLFRADSIEHVFVYSTAPIQMIVGTFRMGRVFRDRPDDLWERFHDSAGIDEVDFFRYFKGHCEGYAIEVKGPHEFSEPIDPWVLDPEFTPPQSFKYVDWGLSDEGHMRMSLSR